MILKLTFVLGAAASGKSAYAEGLVMGTGAPRVYIATSQAYDDEMKEKIAQHRVQRGADWRTVECPYDLPTALAEIRPEEVVLVDCATMWLSNHLLNDADTEAMTRDLVTALAVCRGRVVVVSNEVGMGIVPDNALARRFRNAQGRVNQALAAAADTVVLVAAGLPLVLKGERP
ncbi:bifunctional adenosylcobinamide kinase/adenosylcobinamide-phosphate guanylyltransferase [Shimia sediminis]|uniref:bifunctional adenosylcobinamide kinase/adenosylcobinamide-phosphate guanylyltransferase n=1 Tax=Shimia sediminis TaxID=2497945 RepID=UPI000F8F0C2C|nr:bifunctional adenosylcobinamide kinase/adenosylcobinamide-phosphate guanylyltransferase [Shimia sediminis]